MFSLINHNLIPFVINYQSINREYLFSSSLIFSGIAIGVDGKVFIADGTNIRQVDENGYISTLVGHQHHRSSVWKPMPCEGASVASEVQLNWPSELAISPLDGTLHFIDDNVVLKLTSDMRLTVVAGRPLHCPPPR